MNTGEVVELFEGGWLALGEGLPPARVIVADIRPLLQASQSPWANVSDEWVYELFITTLGY